MARELPCEGENLVGCVM